MNIREYMDKHILTVREVAKKCNVSHPSIHAYLTKKRNPSRKSALRIQKGTNQEVSISEFGYR